MRSLEDLDLLPEPEDHRILTAIDQSAPGYPGADYGLTDQEARELRWPIGPMKKILWPNGALIFSISTVILIATWPWISALLIPILPDSEWAYEDTGIRQLQKEGFLGQGVHVCIIDTGIDMEHPDFSHQELIAIQVIWNRDLFFDKNISELYKDVYGKNAITGSLINTINSNSFTGLSAGEYRFEVIDANGCVYSEIITFNEPDQIVHNFISTHVTCNGWSNGSLIDSISGGVGNVNTYIYSWNTGDTTYDINGIPVGTYTMTVVDENNCLSSESFSINDNNALNSSVANWSDITCYDYCDGKIFTAVSGGAPNYDANGIPIYTYQWNDVLLQTTPDAIGLCTCLLYTSPSPRDRG